MTNTCSIDSALEISGNLLDKQSPSCSFNVTGICFIFLIIAVTVTPLSAMDCSTESTSVWNSLTRLEISFATFRCRLTAAVAVDAVEIVPEGSSGWQAITDAPALGVMVVTVHVGTGDSGEVGATLAVGARSIIVNQYGVVKNTLKYNIRIQGS